MTRCCICMKTLLSLPCGALALCRRLFYGCVLCLCGPVASAAQYTFMVTSADGAPVSHAVISAGPKVQPHAAATASQAAVMDQVNIAFAPYVLPISAGEWVSFPNRDNIRHHVYSFSPAKPFDLKLYSGEPEAPIEFEQPGVIVLGCNIHDNMVGYIYVSERRYQDMSDVNGQATLDSAEVLTTISIWHPGLSINSQDELSLDLAQLPQVDGVFQLQLTIPRPVGNPQEIKSNGRDRFKRFMTPKP
jgi:plastocyanin